MTGESLEDTHAVSEGTTIDQHEVREMDDEAAASLGAASPDLDDAQWMVARMRSASAGALVNTAMAYLAQAMSIVTVPLYLKYLGQEQYGLMLLLITLQTYLSQSNLGLNWAAMNMVGAARAAGDAREVATVVQNAILLATLTAGFALFASAGIAMGSQYGLASELRLEDGVDPWAIVGVGALSALSLIGGPVYLTFVGMGESSTAAFYQGLARVLAIPAMAVIAWRGGSVAQMFGANALIIGGTLIVATVHFALRYPVITRSGLHLSVGQCRRQLWMGVKNMSAELGFLLHVTAPTLALGATCGASAVPLYAVPKSLLDAAFTFGKSQYSVLQPAYAEAAHQGRTDAMALMLSRSLTRNLTQLGIICAGFIVLCGPFVELWTSGRITAPRAAATAIALGAAATFFVQLFQLFLIATDQQLKATRVLAVTGVASLTAIVVAGFAAGLDAVLWTAALTAACVAFIMGFLALRMVYKSPPISRGLSCVARIGVVQVMSTLVGSAIFAILSSSFSPAMCIVVTGTAIVVVYLLGIRLASLLPKVGLGGGPTS